MSTEGRRTGKWAVGSRSGHVEGSTRRRAGRRPSKIGRHTAAYVFLIPSGVFFLAFTLVPVLGGLSLTFAKWDLFSSVQFAGLRNWRLLFSRDDFWLAVWATVRMLLMAVPLNIVLGIGLAVLVDNVTRGKIVLRSVFFAPVIASPVAMSFVMRAMFRDESGILNYMLGTVGLQPVPWLTSAGGAILAVVLFVVWQGVGNSLLIFLAGLQGIPTSLYEAADIDGAKPRQTFFRVTLPMLSPATFFVMVIQTIGLMQVFAHIYTLTGGGPGYATTSLVVLVHEAAFVEYRMGLAATYSFLLFIMILSVTLVQWRYQKRWVFYG